MACLITSFLMIMVGLGLVGVLWLNVTRRTAELGLRRAMGASSISVRPSANQTVRVVCPGCSPSTSS